MLIDIVCNYTACDSRGRESQADFLCADLGYSPAIIRAKTFALFTM